MEAVVGMVNPAHPALFNLDIDLTTHPRVALGASAGTGKTYTLQALAVRNLIEGHCTIGELLMVTFTKAAAAEMRQRLVNALEQAVDLCSVDKGKGFDETLTPIYRVDDPVELAKRHDRAKQALADIDQAVVTTLDSFWSMLVKWLDIAPEGELDAIDESFVVQSTLNHFLIKSANYLGYQPPIEHDYKSLGVVREMLNVPDTRLDLAQVSITQGSAQCLGALATRTVREAKDIRIKSNSYTYSDVLDALDAYIPVHMDEPDAPARRQNVHKLISQFKVVMVDEVQDTNEAQLRLLQKLFMGTDIHLYLVGDAKQAIYEFRGGDINAWDDAQRWVEQGKQRGSGRPTSFELAVNHRSDGPVVEAINHLFEEQHFSYTTTFSPVRARHEASRIYRADGPLAPCALRTIDIKGNKDETIGAIIDDVVRYCAQLLSQSISIEYDGPTQTRPITPGDICVLVRRNSDIFKLNNALLAKGIPSLMASGNVLQSEAATYWLDLLEALVERPDPGALTALTVGPWLRGSTLDTKAIWTLTLSWRAVLDRYGPGALIETVDADTGFAGDLLQRPDGRRLLTDLEHVGELLDASGEWGRRRWFEWLTHARQSFNMRAEEERRRLDLDGGAVELRTSHSAKGLERSIVLVPFAWINSETQALGLPRLYYRQDAEDPLRYDRYLNLDESSDMPEEVRTQAIAAAQFANRRLFYVETTRAKHHVALWHQEAKGGLGTVHALVNHAVTIARKRGSGPGGKPIPPSGPNFAGLANELAHYYPHLFSAQTVDPDDPIARYVPASTSAAGQGSAKAPLPARTDWIAIDMDWRRSSFSGWVAEHDETDGPVFDEPDVDMAGETAFDDGVGGEPVTLTVMPSGAEVGTAIHHIYEVIDFEDPDCLKEIRRILGEQLAGPLADLSHDVLDEVARGLDQVLHTPLGGPLGNLCLAKVGRAQRGDEMGYEFSVQSDGGAGVSLADLGKIWASHVDADDPFAAYAKRLAERGDNRPLRGHLLGFIDLVLQHTHADGRTTWTVMDYKTNRIAIPGVEVLRQGHYQQANLRAEMEAHHYPLQSLLYQVALHRYLRAALVEYDPKVHLGGSAYLFLRGMTGEGDAGITEAVMGGQSGPGVMWWTPPPALIEAVDQAFIG